MNWNLVKWNLDKWKTLLLRIPMRSRHFFIELTLLIEHFNLVKWYLISMLFSMCNSIIGTLWFNSLYKLYIFPVWERFRHVYLQHLNFFRTSLGFIINLTFARNFARAIVGIFIPYFLPLGVECLKFLP